MFDLDNDGKITAKDFELMFNRQMSFLDENSTAIDKSLPFVGQCCFGVAAGWAVGYAARSLYAYKMPIALSGACCYTGFQYLAQQGYIHKEQCEESLQRTIKTMMDMEHKEGAIDKKDLELLMDKKMEIVTAKLGPGGFAAGMVGYLTFALGVSRGLRII